MDPSVRKLINRLDDRIGHLSSQVDELHESVRQVVVVAEADPEMALTKARKVLESVLRRVWEHFLPNEPIGTRPLEEVLQRLQKGGYLPRKQAAYAVAVKELGNVGTHVHDEEVSKSDVIQALSPLISVLEWYFDLDWVEGAGPTPPPEPVGDREPVAPEPAPERRARPLLLVAVAGAATLGVLLVAGWLLKPRGGGSGRPVAGASSPKPDAEPAPSRPKSDQERIQGRWRGFGGYAKQKKTGANADISRMVWTFRGTELTVGNLVDGAVEVQFRGPFALSRGVERKLFDFATETRNGTPLEFNGIYELDDDRLRVCYWVRPEPAKNHESVRPDSFAAGPNVPRRTYLEFRRDGD